MIFVVGIRNWFEYSDGLTEYAKNLYPNFREKGVIYRFYLLFASDSNGIIEQEENLSFVYLKHGPLRTVQKLVYSLKVLIVIFSLCKRSDSFLVHIHGMASLLIVPFIKISFPNAKVIFTQHSLEHLNPHLTFLKRVSARILLKFACVADRSVSVSKYMKMVSSNSILIRSGAPLFCFSRNNESQYLNIIRGVVEKNEYVLYIGRLVPEKGVDLLIEAFCQSVHFGKKKLLIIGKFEDHFYSRLLKKYDLEIINSNFILIGRQQNELIPYFIRNSYIFVVPSFSEGFSLVVQESLNVGRFPLISNIPAHKDFLLPDYCYFDTNINSLVSSMNDYNQIKYFNVNDRYVRSFETVILDHIRLYNSVIAD